MDLQAFHKHPETRLQEKIGGRPFHVPYRPYPALSQKSFYPVEFVEQRQTKKSINEGHGTAGGLWQPGDISYVPSLEESYKWTMASYFCPAACCFPLQKDKLSPTDVVDWSQQSPRPAWRKARRAASALFYLRSGGPVPVAAGASALWASVKKPKTEPRSPSKKLKMASPPS